MTPSEYIVHAYEGEREELLDAMTVRQLCQFADALETIPMATFECKNGYAAFRAVRPLLTRLRVHCEELLAKVDGPEVSSGKPEYLVRGDGTVYPF